MMNQIVSTLSVMLSEQEYKILDCLRHCEREHKYKEEKAKLEGMKTAIEAMGFTISAEYDEWNWATYHVSAG